MMLSVSTFPAGAGHLVVSANDGKWPSIDGVYYAADPPMPDTLVILDAAVFPPKVVGQVEVHHSVIAPPMDVAISPTETIALVSDLTKCKKLARGREGSVSEVAPV